MSIINSIGNTRLLDLTQEAFSCFSSGKIPQGISILAKSEFLNPTGSIKDRIVRYMVERAEKAGQLSRRSVLIESTSGNTGTSVAMVAAAKGYQSLLVIPARVSDEKQRVMEKLGATICVTPNDVTIASPMHYVNVAQQLAQTTPDGWYLNQYNSSDNAAAHYHTTGAEIWSQTQGNIDVFLSVLGSGGTLSGVGRYLKQKNPNIKIIGVDPVGSIYHYYFLHHQLPPSNRIVASKVEGAGSDHLTVAMDFKVIDDIITFSDQNAFVMARRMAKKTGLLLGGSSGANLWAACHFARAQTKATKIVTLLPDSGMKYLSKFYTDAWMDQQGFYGDELQE